MSASSRVRVYIACSLDGFIAGPDDDLSWLAASEHVPNTPAPPTGAMEFDGFMAQVGALLMGRRTHDVVAGMGQWIYGDMPVLVATHRPLDPMSETVRPISGDITQLVAQAKDTAGDKDVYLDGGTLIRQALDAGLVDELVITFVPVLLAEGIRLFDGLVARQSLEFVAHHRYGHDKLQVTARVRRP
ncbi:MAG: dihydrofolate reductase [Deltaproteobacteria bacterium]|nr:dihydrofolate reductase [Deltaproteobacteria bacterium]